MIARLIATVGAAAPVAAEGAVRLARQDALLHAPVIWSFLGEPFEAAAMVAGLFGCFAARFWLAAGQQLRKEHRWSIDVPVSAMALAFTATLVIHLQPNSFIGLLVGGGAGMLGEGIFKIAELSMAKAMAAAGVSPPDEPPSPAD